MSRQTYSRTDETFIVLSGHESEVAYEWDKDVSYVNKIKNGVERDPFALFFPFWKACCRTSAPVLTWLNKMNAEYVRSRRLHVAPGELSGVILQKVESDSETLKELLTSVQDGKLDKAECHAILGRLQTNKQITTAIEQSVLARLGEISDSEERGLRVA